LFDGRDSINGLVERNNRADAAGFGLSHQVRLGEIDAVEFVNLKRAEEQRQTEACLSYDARSA
jgi:hypothetical protein